MDFSKFGKKMTCNAGILSLMEDLGKAAATGGPGMIMMGGGNPAQVPEFQEIMRKRLLEICGDPEVFRSLIGAYGPPKGETGLVAGLAKLFQQECGWQIGPENICLTNGSQTAFFMLFNLFGGACPGGAQRRICLPLAPEYIGYADLGISEDLFISFRPRLEMLPDNQFKYHIDFERLEIGEDIGAICVSRPTIPTGNVVTDAELTKLASLAAQNEIPLIVDSAYGLPFPGMVYCDAKPTWNENLILCLSLSKLGLPSVRTGIVVARREVIQALTAMNAIMSLSPNSFGPVLVQQFVESQQITEISRKMMQPFYRRKMEMALQTVKQFFADLPYRVHRPEGAMFIWFSFEALPISSLELYRRLKEKGVLVVSGHYFFPGLEEEWPHRQECIRVTYTENDEKVKRGLEIISEVVRAAYTSGS